MCSLYSKDVNTEQSPVYCYSFYFKCFTVLLPIKTKIWKALKSKKKRCAPLFQNNTTYCNHATYWADSSLGETVGHGQAQASTQYSFAPQWLTTICASLLLSREWCSKILSDNKDFKILAQLNSCNNYVHSHFCCI